MGERIELPPPKEAGGASLADALGRRRSVRDFAPRELTWSEIGQLLWAAQGITDRTFGLRAAPSAGALYPLEIDSVTRSGVFRYQPGSHTLVRREPHDVRPGLARAALDQESVAAAPCVFAISVVPARTMHRYGHRGTRYVHMEAGHAAQNLLLQAQALGLVGAPVGAFDDEAVARALRAASGEEPLYLVPVGWPPGSTRARSGPPPAA
ncbi:MAG TPA: SagB/ThcOx family dehydrogenase [Burkholderiales bacterium]|nr:SagB/ThcOx family dehydrogenase [Burkholderiales bacterium]